MTEWELGHRTAPSYVLRFMAYYVNMQKMLNEKKKGGVEDEK